MDKEAIEKHREAGKIAAQAREFGKSLIKVDAKLIDVADKVEEKIMDLGAKPGFPAQISRNEIAAHYCPGPEDEAVFQKGDVVKLDVGTEVDGYVGDTAVTVDLGDNAKLVQASIDALNNAIKIIKPGITLGEIGKVISESIEKLGFKPVRNLSGHGVGKYIIHGPPQIPNFDTGDETKLEKGQVVAIEPFATTGAGLIEEKGEATIFQLTGKKGVRGLITRQILKEIEKYNGLPFTTRWLTKKFSSPKVNFALRELKALEILHEYKPLPDRNKGLVSQAEHTVLVDDEVEVLTK